MIVLILSSTGGTKEVKSDKLTSTVAFRQEEEK